MSSAAATPTAPAGLAGHDGVPMPQRIWATASLMLAILMAVLDGSIANVALPTIARQLHTDPANSIWVVNAFQIAVTVSLLALASAGEVVGYRRVYTWGLAIFTAASFACAVSNSLPMLVAARVVQGFGGAGIMAVNAALIRFIFPRAQLGRGVGLTAMTVATGSAIGPTVASAILSVADWPWLFAVNVPIGFFAVALAGRVLPATPRGAHRFDWLSAILSALTFFLLITGIDGFSHGGSLGLIIAELAAAAICGFVLVRRQLGRQAPLLPVDLLRIRLFALSICTSLVSFTAQMMAFVSLPFFFQIAAGRSQVETGLLMTPWPLLTAIVSPWAGRLSDRVSPGLLGGIGMAIFGLGLLAMGLLPSHPADWDIVWRMALTGFGFGIFQSPNNRALIGSAPPGRSGGAGGMLSTARLLGQSVGAALVAVIFSTATGVHGNLPVLIAAGFAGIAACVSVTRIGR